MPCHSPFNIQHSTLQKGYRHGNDNQNQEKTNKLIEIRLNSCVITFKIKIHLLL
jgi:hypothetical protein